MEIESYLGGSQVARKVNVLEAGGALTGWCELALKLDLIVMLSNHQAIKVLVVFDRHLVASILLHFFKGDQDIVAIGIEPYLALRGTRLELDNSCPIIQSAIRLSQEEIK